MSRPAIEVEGLSKHYRLGVFGYGSLQKDAASLWARLRGQPDPNAPLDAKSGARIRDFWALRDVSFSVGEGEVLGVIGANGAGKSTLLKILSRITAPTTGRVCLRGRVASMLEVGTGFHPELTGRENIYLNGAILGMTRSEIDRKFDEIVDFSGVEQFIDTPVKRYSSGMYVRLAFAVAAHLEPEILLVDEVLAVGDAAFQKKCLGKMGDVAKQGRTVLFVSHNMAAVNALTRNCIWIHQSRLHEFGDTNELVRNYVAFTMDKDKTEVRLDRPSQQPKAISLRMISLARAGQSQVLFGENLSFVVEFASTIHAEHLRFGITLINLFSGPVTSTFTEPTVSSRKDQASRYRIDLPPIKLAPGNYQVAISICKGDLDSGTSSYDVVREGPLFSVLPFDEQNSAVARWDVGWGSLCLDEAKAVPVGNEGEREIQDTPLPA